MEILNSYVAADRVRVATGMETKGQKRLELEIGKGKGSRHSYLTPSEAKQVAYALLMTVEQISS